MPLTENAAAPFESFIIEGVDVAFGMERFGNSEDAYIKILSSYAANTRRLLRDIELLLESGKLADYSIAVHGIKGSSLGVGAAIAGEIAKRLELLAKEGKSDQVSIENGVFMDYMAGLLDSIDGALGLYYSKNKKTVIAAPEPGILRELREACGEYDAGKVDAIMARLDAFEYENGAELVAWLREQAGEMNYDSIANGEWPGI